MQSVALLLADIDRVEAMLAEAPSPVLWEELDRLVFSYLEEVNKR